MIGLAALPDEPNDISGEPEIIPVGSPAIGGSDVGKGSRTGHSAKDRRIFSRTWRVPAVHGGNRHDRPMYGVRGVVAVVVLLGGIDFRASSGPRTSVSQSWSGSRTAQDTEDPTEIGSPQHYICHSSTHTVISTARV